MLRPWVEPAPVPATVPFELLPDDELETPALPREHPRWIKDAIAISARARRLISELRPPQLRVLSFWDHRTHTIAIAGRALGVDSSGSYYAVQ